MLLIQRVLLDMPILVKVKKLWLLGAYVKNIALGELAPNAAQAGRTLAIAWDCYSSFVAETVLNRRAVAQHGKRLEYFTIAWNALEGIVAVVAGAFAGSRSLVGFGLDSCVEVISGATLLWRMSTDRDLSRRERNEQRSLKNGWQLFPRTGSVYRVRVNYRLAG
jgi:hypothetical protein